MQVRNVSPVIGWINLATPRGAIAAALLTFSLAVQAAVITQTNSFVAAGLSGGTETLTFDQFDPALGTLDEVAVTFTNTFTVSATGSTPSLFASVFVLLPTSVVYLDPGAPFVTPLIDVNTVAGALSSNINTFSHSETHTLTGSTTEDDFLDNYFGTGTFDGVLQIGEIGLFPADDITFTSFNVTRTLGVSVVYNYTASPQGVFEPSALWMVALGLFLTSFSLRHAPRLHLARGRTPRRRSSQPIA